MEQIERIKAMERRLDHASQVVMRLSSALDDYVGAQEDIRLLEAYYGSDEWKQDFTDDGESRLPKHLKRGVLSEDAVWNLLEDNRDIINRIKELGLHY